MRYDRSAPAFRSAVGCASLAALAMLCPAASIGATPTFTIAAQPPIEGLSAEVVSVLTHPTPIEDLRKTFRLTVVNGSLWFTATPTVRATLAADITVWVGASFAVEGQVATVLPALAGTLTIAYAGDTRVWRLAPGNFGNMMARAIYRPASESLGIVLPVVLTQDGREEPTLHAALALQCLRHNETFVCTSLGFQLEQSIGRYFPSAPSLRQLVPGAMLDAQPDASSAVAGEGTLDRNSYRINAATAGLAPSVSLPQLCARWSVPIRTRGVRARRTVSRTRHRVQTDGDD